jgi:hypothetical protein
LVALIMSLCRNKHTINSSPLTIVFNCFVGHRPVKAAICFLPSQFTFWASSNWAHHLTSHTVIERRELVINVIVFNTIFY